MVTPLGKDHYGAPFLQQFTSVSDDELQSVLVCRERPVLRPNSCSQRGTVRVKIVKPRLRAAIVSQPTYVMRSLLTRLRGAQRWEDENKCPGRITGTARCAKSKAT